MSFLVRKIDKAKWLQNDIVNGADVSADAITNCTKTIRNTLSTWRIDSEAQVDEAVLAIVSSQQHIEAIDVVWVSKVQLETAGIHFQDTPGGTPIANWVDRHVDIVDLTYRSLGTLANCIVNSFSKNSVKRYTRGMLIKLLKDAIGSGRLQSEKIAQSVTDKL